MSLMLFEATTPCFASLSGFEKGVVFIGLFGLEELNCVSGYRVYQRELTWRKYALE